MDSITRTPVKGAQEIQKGVKYFATFLAVLSIQSAVLSAGEDPTTHPNPLPLSTIRTAHPRLWFNSDNVHLLRERWTNPAYAHIVGRYASKTDALSLALEGLATHNSSKCSSAASKVRFDYEPEGDGRAGYANTVSLVFDWCHSYLNSTEKADLIETIEVVRDRNRDDPNFGVRNRFYWHETFLLSSFPYISSVLAIEGEPGVSSELRSAQNVLQNLQEMGDEVSGDGGYRTYIYQGNEQTLIFMMWSYATDFDFSARSNFTKNLTKWSAYKLAPTQSGFIRGPADDDADWTGYTNDRMSAGGFYLLASHFDDPVAHWLGRHLESEFDQDTLWHFAGPSFTSLIHYDPNRQALSPEQAGMPLDVYFEETGMVHSRSSWDRASDVVHSWFYNGPTAGHAGDNQNHFTIWRGDDGLIIQGGNYLGTPSTYHSHYFERTISDNTLLFSPVGSNSPDLDGGQTMRRSNYSVSREAYPVGDRVGSWPGQHMYSGEIINFEAADEYTIASGDSTLAYDHDHVNSSIRDYVYLKPGLFLVRDRFSTTNVATVRSLIHSRNRPQYSGSETVVQGTSNAGIIEANGTKFVIENGGSEAEVEVLWPSSPLLRFVGGSGYEGYSDGYNSNPWTDCQDWLKSNSALATRVELINGQWRTEIETTPSIANGNLLHAIYVSERDPASRPSYSVQEAGGNLIVTVVHHGGQVTVTFPRDGKPFVSVNLAEESDTLFSDSFIDPSLGAWSAVVM